MEPEDLSHALSDAVGDLTPELPEHAALAAAGRRRKRNRLVALSGTAAAVLAVGAAVALPHSGGSQGLVSEPGPTATSEAPSPTESPSPTPSATSTPSVTLSAAPSGTAAGPVAGTTLTAAPTCAPPDVSAFTVPARDGGKGYPSGFFLSAGEQSDLTLEPTGSGGPRSVMTAVSSVTHSAAGRFYVTTAACTRAAVYTFVSGGPARLLVEATGELMLSPDGHLLSISSESFTSVPGLPSHVRVVDAATGAVVRTLDFPRRPQAWLADGSGFFYAADDGLHRRHLDGTEEPVVTQGPTGCYPWRLVSRAYDGTLLGAASCTGQSDRIARMAEDGTPGADVATGSVDGLLAAPGGNAALVWYSNPEAISLVASGEQQRDYFDCTHPSLCGSVYAASW